MNKETDTAKRIWEKLIAAGFNPCAAAGILGNLEAESALKPDNLQNSYNHSLGMSDVEYTAAVDNGAYQNFTGDAAGYGLAQWTYPTRKARLLAFAQNRGVSIGDADMQTDFLVTEMREDYPGVYRLLMGEVTVRQASDKVLLDFERPADTSDGVRQYRAGLGERIYARLAPGSGNGESAPSVGETPQNAEPEPWTQATVELPLLQYGAQGESVRAMQSLLCCRGFDVGPTGADGSFGENTLGGLRAFQRAKGIEADGICTAETWERLLKG